MEKNSFYIKIKEKQASRGINSLVIRFISAKRKESKYLTNFRIDAFSAWKHMMMPSWSKLLLPKINFHNASYFSEPKRKADHKDIKKAFLNLGVSVSKKKNLPTDAIFDSISFLTTGNELMSKNGVIFCSLSTASKYYNSILENYIGKAVACEDNFFSALNSCVFSDGSFCFIPQKICCPINLSSYFRINSKKSSQFERTLIIGEKNSKVCYLEACTASAHYKKLLHAAVVEIFAFSNAKIDYFTTQNWYSGSIAGAGGIYNFVTKRGICLSFKSEINWLQIESGSSATWKYPSCILLGKSSIGTFASIALTKNYQQADTGSKMIHLGKKTKSKILAKSVSCNNSINVYRGLVKLGSEANFSRNYSQCDSFLVGPFAMTCAYPYILSNNGTSLVEHEASVSKITDEELFYMLQRGIEKEKAIFLIISGQCKNILDMLPFEISSEAKLILK